MQRIYVDYMQTLPQYLDSSGLMRGPGTICFCLPKKDCSLFLNMNEITKEAATRRGSVMLRPTDDRAQLRLRQYQGQRIKRLRREVREGERERKQDPP